MDFGNERYVRLYTRETTTYLRLTWEGQAMLAPVLRLMDRSGVMDLGGLPPSEAVALRMLKWPAEVVAAGVDAMIGLGIIDHRGDQLVWPRYLEAQETPQTDAQRARESRARRREIATQSDALSRNVTGSSRAVTPCHSSLALPALPSVPSVPAVEPTPPASQAPKGAGGRGTRLPDDWQPAETERAYCKSLGLEPLRIAEDFRDYWHAAPGARGVKRDWPATWRTWCRRESDRQAARPTSSPAAPKPRAPRTEERNDLPERFRRPVVVPGSGGGGR